MSIFCLITSLLIGINCYAISNINLFNIEPPLDESVIFIPAHFSDGNYPLETTIFTPKTSGPWPLVVINHGADGTLPDFHQQPRSRFIELGKFFLSRGYMVAIPMREGFSKSG